MRIANISHFDNLSLIPLFLKKQRTWKAKVLQIKNFIIWSILPLLLLLAIVGGMREAGNKQEILESLRNNQVLVEKIATSSNTLLPTPTALVTTKRPSTTPTDSPDDWGKVRQVGQYTFEGRVGCDERMATSQEIYEALNHYRQVHGRNTLGWNDKLAEVANMRAAQITANGGKSDQHAGFKEFTSNQENYYKVGFRVLSENTAGGGCPLLGVHIIEWLFARDKPHNDAQLDSGWTAVGIGVSDVNVSVIFGGEPI